MSTENQNLEQSQDTPEAPTVSNSYPSNPDEHGFYYESEDEQEDEILTKVYENGSKVKKLILTNGKTATVRMLKGRDMVKTKSMLPNYKGTEIEFETVNLSLAVKIEEKTMTPEYFMDDLLQTDYAKLLACYGMLNFQLGRSTSHG